MYKQGLHAVSCCRQLDSAFHLERYLMPIRYRFLLWLCQKSRLITKIEEPNGLLQFNPSRNIHLKSTSNPLSCHQRSLATFYGLTNWRSITNQGSNLSKCTSLSNIQALELDAASTAHESADARSHDNTIDAVGCISTNLVGDKSQSDGLLIARCGLFIWHNALGLLNIPKWKQFGKAEFLPRLVSGAFIFLASSQKG